MAFIRSLLLLLLASVFFLASCKKDKDFKTAVVRDTGDISVGGCGYLLDVVGEGEKRPYYLPSAYQINGLRVKVKLRNSGTLDTCGNSIPRSFHDLVWIDDIKREN